MDPFLQEKSFYVVVRTREADPVPVAVDFKVFHVIHGSWDRRYTVVLREDGTTTAYTPEGNKVDGDESYAFKTFTGGDDCVKAQTKEGFDHLADLLAAVVRDFVASGKRTLCEDLDFDLVHVIMAETRRSKVS